MQELDKLKLLANRLNYEPASGCFYWASSGKQAGCIRSDGYVIIGCRQGGKKLQEYAHRIAFFKMSGSVPDMIDHINRNRSDNSWKNLKASNHSENAKNNGKLVKNIRKRGDRWEAYQTVAGKFIYLGMHDTASDALRAARAGRTMEKTGSGINIGGGSRTQTKDGSP